MGADASPAHANAQKMHADATATRTGRGVSDRGCSVLAGDARCAHCVTAQALAVSPISMRVVMAVTGRAAESDGTLEKMKSVAPILRMPRSRNKPVLLA